MLNRSSIYHQQKNKYSIDISSKDNQIFYTPKKDSQNNMRVEDVIDKMQKYINNLSTKIYEFEEKIVPHYKNTITNLSEKNFELNGCNRVLIKKIEELEKKIFQQKRELSADDIMQKRVSYFSTKKNDKNEYHNSFINKITKLEFNFKNLLDRKSFHKTEVMNLNTIVSDLKEKNYALEKKIKELSQDNAQQEAEIQQQYADINHLLESLKKKKTHAQSKKTSSHSKEKIK